ncbi:SnoaL-like domain protein [Planctomycetes bacterium CA13]|uniref:SnoaL-like domain protein n=1 Tax=Novipirellula herctigrandis TaxID=2527986 RepID=A0A5C5Z1Z0_9BACT|nr:SnoaL-like domain protein [Planctomycetes bacterium CA13]
MRNPTFINCLLLLFAIPGLASAQAPDREIASVSGRVASYLEAFNRRDLDACAEHFSETAEYIVPGSSQRIQGRTAIREALETLLKTDEKFELSVTEQRFRKVTQDAVLEEGTATLVSESHGLERAQYLVVHVQQGQKWYRDSVHEVAVVTSVAESKLRELEWLIGDWTYENAGGSTEIHGQWINNQRFISRSFTVRGGNGNELNGRQIIGWDPSAGVIRSWSFDSQGAFEQGVWHRVGNRWRVKVRAVLPDGSVGSEQRVLTPETDGKLTSEVVEQQVQGRLLPLPGKVSLVRRIAK